MSKDNPEGEYHGVVCKADDGSLRIEPDAVERRFPIKNSRKLAPGTGPLESLYDGMRVTYGWDNGQVRDIRPEGARLEKPVSAQSFINPYMHVPAALRTGMHESLQDRFPVGHHRLQRDRWTGRIGVTLTTATPLLLLDTARPHGVASNGHEIFDVRLRDGAPHLPATSVKGMLRSGCEAVTNSRFGVFDKHEDRLGRRMRVDEAQHMVPARVTAEGGSVELLLGDTPLGGQRGHDAALHAAWLPQYKVKTPTAPGAPPRVCYADGKSPQHGDPVQAVVERQEHKRGFRYWQVLCETKSLRKLAYGESVTPDACDVADLPPGPSGNERRMIRGWVFISNQNIGNKHDERIFFSGLQQPRTHGLTKELKDSWEELIRNYRDAHRPSDIRGRRKGGQIAEPDEYLGHEPGQTAWSPHQYDDDYNQLKPGSLCYATVGRDGTVTGLYPVMIARSLYDCPPRGLLDPSLRPAEKLSELSPADRIFGWTNQNGSGAFRGQVRLGPVTCRTDPHEAVERFSDPLGLPLAVLGQPKPQQARFYLAADKQAPHKPLPNGDGGGTAYAREQALRGRKQYWHHPDLPDGYWDNPTQDRTQGPPQDEVEGSTRNATAGRSVTGHHQEYRRPDGERVRDDQNRSVLGWVRPGTEFHFTLDVENLADVELGSLTWLLTMGEGHHLRLGLGKPLGFGSVRATVDPDTTDLRRGDAWRERYRSLSPTSPAKAQGSAQQPSAAATCQQLADTFAAAMKASSPPHGENTLDAFLAAAKGVPGYAVHYPRVRTPEHEGHHPPPHPEGRSYEWFTENDKPEGKAGNNDPQKSLPSWKKPQLPIHSTD